MRKKFFALSKEKTSHPILEVFFKMLIPFSTFPDNDHTVFCWFKMAAIWSINLFEKGEKGAKVAICKACRGNGEKRFSPV